MPPQPAVVNVLSDSDDSDDAATYPSGHRKRSRPTLPAAAAATNSPDSLDDFSTTPPLPKRCPPVSPIVLDDTPTPPKRQTSVALEQPVPVVADTPQSFVPCSVGSRGGAGETPNSVLQGSLRFGAAVSETTESACCFGSDIVVAETPGLSTSRSAGRTTVPGCSSAVSAQNLSGAFCPIFLDSDDELDDIGYREPSTKLPSNTAKSESMIQPETSSCSHKVMSSTSTDQKDYSKSTGPHTTFSAHKTGGTTNFGQHLRSDLLCEDSTLYDADVCTENYSLQEESKNKRDGNAQRIEAKKKLQEQRRLKKEEKARLSEEKKQKREEDKKQKEAKKKSEQEEKKLEQEKKKLASKKLALESIVAEIDSTIVESGSVGGSLLTRFAEKELKYRVTTNSVKGSILWKMEFSKEIAQNQASVSEVPYILFVLQAEKFCGLISSGSFLNHVRGVRSCYPTFTICYVTNKLMSYIKKREQIQYKNPSSSNSWKRPPVEEVLCRLATHYDRVHSRQCADEAEVADHVVGLTYSLADCRSRKQLTRLSVRANGLTIPKDFIDKDLIKKDTWMKSLIAIPKVQPRHAKAIWKKYPSMRSLLNVYLDPSKTDRDKELLLKELKLEGTLGDENRRFGEVCSRRVYRILMAQNGATKTDDVEKP